MKIAVLFDNFGPHHVARLAAAAKLCDLLAIEVVGRSAEYAWTPAPESPGFQRVTLVKKMTRGAAYGKVLSTRLNEVLSSFRPDVIAIPGWSSGAALRALEWSIRQGVPSVLMSDIQAIDEARRSIQEWMKRRCLRAFGAALVGGQSHRQYAAQLGISADRIFLGYDAVDDGYFARGAAAARASAGRVRKELSLPDHYFLASNRFIPKKNLFFLLGAYARYRRESTHQAGRDEHDRSAGPWDLVLLGDGVLRPEIETLVAKLGLDACVHRPGFKQYQELPAYYGLADAFVHASTTEPWGLVVNEAMASGLPVIVSNRCGCAAELVLHGENGFQFDPTDEAELSRCMAGFAHNEPRRQAMGRRSCELIRQWGPQSFAQGLVAAAETARRAGPPRRSWIDNLSLQSLIKKQK